MTRSPLIVLLSLSLSLGLTAATATPAAACGGPTREIAVATVPSLEDEARAVVEAHFTALARGDAKAVRALWSKKAKVVSRNADGEVVRTSKLPVALKRWIAHRDGLAWKLGAVDQLFDGNLVVHATVTWNGIVYEDTMTVTLDGGARITAKTSTVRVVATAKEQPHVGY